MKKIALLESNPNTGLVASIVEILEDDILSRYVLLTFHLRSTGETIVVAYAKIHKSFDLDMIVGILHEEFPFQGMSLKECLELVHKN